MQDKDLLFDRLLTEYISQTISVGDKELLFSMIRESEDYKRQYEEVVRLNTMLHLPQFQSNKDKDYLLLEEKLQFTSGLTNKVNKISWYNMLGRVVAAAVILTIVSFGSVFFYKKTMAMNDLSRHIVTSTPLGGQTQLHLPDGSVAWINAKSELKYDLGFGKTDRRIHLEGEAYFEVNKNEKLPFSVSTGDMEVIATGTIFNVRSYTDDDIWEVNLLEGGVDVLVSGKRYKLLSDEKAIYDKITASVTVESTDAHMAAQWTKGRLSFSEASIPEIYKMLERHFNVRILIGSEELKEEYFFGSINLEMSLGEILNLLDVAKKYRIEVKDDIIIVKKR